MFKPTNSSALTKPHGINVTTSAYGKAVQLIYGLCQTQPDLVWYNDWQYHNSPSNHALNTILGQDAAKGKFSKKGGQRYYSAAVDLLLGHAPCRGILSAWYNNLKLAVLQASASGFIYGGSFTFVPIAGNSIATITGTVPGTPFQVTAPGFVSDLNDVKAGGVKLQPATPTPGAGQYTVTTGGVYTFNAAQSGDAYIIKYRKAGSGTPSTLVSIFAVTAAETFSYTFNDFGAPGSVAVYGTWDRPLWNQTYGVPGRIDAGAFHARDPYSWNWDGVNPTVHVPAALEGYPVTVYYGVPVILKSDGTVFSTTKTPLDVLNLEFEQEFGTGPEYVNHLDQQIEMTWVSGLGSVRFDLGTGNNMPQLNLETLGAFVQWPNGDADVADIIADIIASGPVFV